MHKCSIRVTLAANTTQQSQQWTGVSDDVMGLAGLVEFVVGVFVVVGGLASSQIRAWFGIGGTMASLGESRELGGLSNCAGVCIAFVLATFCKC